MIPNMLFWRTLPNPYSRMLIEAGSLIPISVIVFVALDFQGNILKRRCTELFYNKGVYKDFAKCTGKTCAKVSF